MRILYATTGPAFPGNFSGGAWRSAHELLLALSRRGAACAAHGGDPEAPAEEPSRHDCGYPVTLHRDVLSALPAVLSELRPDVVGSHLDDAIAVLRLAARAGALPAWFIRNPECSDHPPSALAEAAELGVRFFASSPFLARHMAEAHGVEAVPLYSPVDVDRYRVPPAGRAGAITMINPVPDKGLSTLIGLLLRCPDHPFLVVEGWSGHDQRWARVLEVLGRFPNVRVVPAVRDMRSVYRRTRLLIVPSRWQEGFGRVAAEAHASGIPVIASRVGGLADLRAGTVLVDDYTSADAWADAVERVWSDPTLYQRLSAEALAFSEVAPYRSERVAERFLEEVSGGRAAPALRRRAAGRR